MPLTRARQVTGPTMPSTVIPSACWKARTAALVGFVFEILKGLDARRERLAAMSQTEAWSEWIDTGRTIEGDWESWTTPERNAYLRRMGVTIMCAKGRPPVCDFARIAGRDWKALRASAR